MNPLNILGPENIAFKITKLKVRVGSNISPGTIICLYDTNDQKNVKLKSTVSGTVDNLCCKVDEDMEKGSIIATVKTISCKHPTVMKDMCADCGADLRQKAGLAGDRKEKVEASVAMVHSIPELIVSQEQAMELGKADETNLLNARKLVLLVDLDQTLIHTTNDDIPPNLKDVFHFQLPHGPTRRWYHLRLRPFTKEFLEKISQLYELHICTFGVRLYAHTIARYLDPDGKYFSHRILSRDECFSQNSKTANLKALFPCGDSMVCIIDDREDVWNFAPNLIHVKPYRFFQGTADINAPPGLAKTEHDSDPLTHKVRRISRSNSVEPESSDAGEGKETDSEKTTSAQSLELSKKVEKTAEPDSVDDGKNKENLVQNKKTVKESEEENKLDEKIKEAESESSNNKCREIDKTSDTKESLRKAETGKESPTVETEKKGSKREDEKMDTNENEPAADGNDEGNNASEQDLEKVEQVATKADENDKDQVNSSGDEEKEEERSKTPESVVEEIEWDDEDDYLMYLIDILTNIHQAFYDLHDQRSKKPKPKMEDKPDIRKIIPYVKRKVLKGHNIVFSGVFPRNIKPENSRAYIVAKALGANIQPSLVPGKKGSPEATTHLVAALPGTAKVRTAQKYKNVKIVTPAWLWCCAERYEKVEESLFKLPLGPMDKGLGSGQQGAGRGEKRKSPEQDSGTVDPVEKKPKKDSDNNRSEACTDPIAECDSGSREGSEADKNSAEELFDNDDDDDEEEENVSDINDGKNAGSNSNARDQEEEKLLDEVNKQARRFSNSYNPLFALSDNDREFMDKEIEDMMEDDDEDEGSDEDDDERDSRLRKRVLRTPEPSSSEDSLSGEFPRGLNMKRSSSHGSDSSSDPDSPCKDEGHDTEDTDMEKYEKTLEAFAPEDSASSDNEDSIGSVDDEMAEAVEKEFLAQFN